MVLEVDVRRPVDRFTAGREIKEAEKAEDKAQASSGQQQEPARTIWAERWVWYGRRAAGVRTSWTTLDDLEDCGEDEEAAGCRSEVVGRAHASCLELRCGLSEKCSMRGRRLRTTMTKALKSRSEEPTSNLPVKRAS